MQQLKINKSLTRREGILNQYLSDISRIPMISPEEECELAMRAKEGDEEAFEALVKANLRFVVSVAKQYQGHGMDLPDLINEGNEGLLKAAAKFDPTRGFKFISYAVWWIRQSILQGLSEDSRMVRLPLNRLGDINRLSKIRESFIQDNEREPTDEELSEFIGLSPEKIGETLRDSLPHVSFDVPIGEDSDGTLLDIIPDSSSKGVDSPLEEESLRSDIDDVLQILTPREREIVRMSFGLGCKEKSLEEIGDELGLTRERVRQLKEKAIRRISHSPARDRLTKYLCA